MLAPPKGRPWRRIVFPTLVVGIGLGGFFDGILLHQILQWHHLLSLVPGEPYRDLGTQILADGVFHILMYLVTGFGLWLLWRRRRELSDASVGWRTVAGGGLLGFGLWNVIDVGFFHWILGIHRIRVGVPDPMTYDLIWLLALGLVPMIIGWMALRKGQASGDSIAAAGTLGLLALVSAPVASLPPRESNSALVVFNPGTTPAEALNAALAAQAPILWVDPKGRAMAVILGDRGTASRLREAGAFFVTRSPALAGCASALRAA